MRGPPLLPLTVTSEASPPLGPLSVEVIPETGDSMEEFALSSLDHTHVISVPPGRYAVMARRPNGNRLLQSVVVKQGAPARVSFAESLMPSPNEFLQEETGRGEIASASAPSKGGRPVGLLRGIAAQSLQAVTTARLASNKSASHAKSTWTLQAWGTAGEELTKESLAQLDSAPGVPFLKVRTDKRCLALGLCDDEGFGPIVITPPFRQPLHITFLAEALATRPAARYLNPSGRRAPVALVTPEEASTADLLTALGAPEVEHAADLWERGSGDAVAFVQGKFKNPAEALLGAHFLLRFLPDRLPLDWADNLSRAYPEAADGPVIAAWLRLLSGAPDVRRLAPKKLNDGVQQNLAKALVRPITLFARARRLLVDGLRFLPPDVRERSKSASPRKAEPSRFLDYGAHAGGLEAFWGINPASPGPKVLARLRSIEIARVKLGGATFIQVG